METINDLFASAVKRFAERPALLEPSEGTGEITTLTFSMLQQRVQQFAGYLQGQQLQKGERVLIWSASRIDWMVAHLATLLVGGVVVPLDVNTKEDFLSRIASTTEARYLITTSRQYQSLIKEPPVPLIDIEALPTGAFQPDQVACMQKDDLAELVFTSGTTGQPKGVMLSHGNIASNAQA
ncbi:MAG: AMP-binding protein, partial [Ktedonobacteraceae bacterium]